MVIPSHTHNYTQKYQETKLFIRMLFNEHMMKIMTAVKGDASEDQLYNSVLHETKTKICIYVCINDNVYYTSTPMHTQTHAHAHHNLHNITTAT